MKPKFNSNPILRALFAAALVGCPVSVSAATFSKLDNTDDLNLTTSWSGGIVPGALDVALWDSSVTGANSTILGSNLSLGGLSVTSPGGAVTIGAGSTLTLGTSGINLSTATQNLSISSGLTLANGSQSWNVASGRTLALSTGAFSRSAGTSLNLPGSGSVTSTMTGLVNTNNILGPWATVGTGSSTRFATLSTGSIIGFTGATASGFNWASGNNNTFNYDVAAALGATPIGVGRQANTVRYTGVAGTQNYGNNNTTTFTINGLLNVGTGTLTVSELGGTAQGQVGIGTNNGNELVLGAANADITVKIPIINTGANAGSVLITGPGTVTIDSAGGVSTYTGATTVASGTLSVGGAGNINTTSGITINGAGAKYLHTSTVASTRNVTLTRGTLDGTGTLGSITVADNSSAVVTHGNGGAGSLTFGALTFNGDATVNLNVSAGAGLKVNGALATTPANGQVVLNVPTLVSNGLVNLINFGSFTGNPSDFTANFTGLGSRQVAGAIQLNGSNLAVEILGENLVWTGAGSDAWQTATTGDDTGPNNWARKAGQTATNFWAADSVEFNDTYDLGSGSVAVTQSQVVIGAAVSPASTIFNNSSIDYQISGAAISAGALVKSGTGSVTLLNANTYAGATTINQGKLQLGNGTTDGSIANTIAVTNNGTLEYNLSAAQTAAYAISGTGSVVKKGGGTLTLTGASTYSGGTTVDQGLLVATSASMNGGPIAISSGATLTFTGNAQTSSSTLSGAGSILNNTANTIVFTGDHSGFSGSFVHSAAANNTQFNSASSASQNASYSLTAGEIIFAANGDYTVTFGALSGAAGNIRGGNTATGTTTVEVGNLGFGSIIASNFNNGATKVLALKKVGTGTLTLSGGASYSGATDVIAGTLAFTTVSKTLGTSAFTVADGAGLSVKAAASGTTMLPTSSLTLGTSNLTFDFSLLTPTVPQISTGALTLNGTPSVNLLGANALGTGTYKLIDYTSLSGSGSFPTGSFSVGNRSTASIVDNVVDTSIDLQVLTESVKWTGLDDGTWLLGSTGANSNWKLGVAGTPTDYLADDQVLFDDTAEGTRTVVIDSSNVFPASTTFNTATSDYTLSGAFGIASGSLAKSGSGTVVITNSNSYNGATTINGGTLQLGNGTLNGALTATSSVINNGTLALNPGADQTVAFPISGTGHVSKSGAGILTLTGANTYSGGTSLTSGVLTLAGAGTLGSGPVALSSGTTLNINANQVSTNTFTGSGSIVNTASFTHNGDFTGFSGTYTHNSAAVSTGFSSASHSSQNAAYVIASEQGSIQGMVVAGNGDYTLKLGSLSGVANSLFRGGLTATGTTTLEIGNLNTDTVFAGSINNGTTKILALTKVGSGTLTLSGSNDYTGATLVNGGTLSVTGSLSVASAVTVASGATLRGNGTVAGTVTASGTIAPGVGAGTLNSGATTLTGTLAVEIDGAAGDKLASSGAITLTGATLTVNLLSGGFTEASYVIAEGTSITGSFASVPSGYAVSIVSGGIGQQAVLTSAAGYSSWATANVGGDAADLDTDSDGVKNGVEYFMNAAAGFTANPGIVSGAITWPNGGNIPASAYGTQFVIQTSGDLSIWTEVPVGSLTTNSNGPSGSLTYTLPTGSAKLFVRLKVTPN
jgi:autotransporter-associated beta strand protein